jgi:hypothetical protein
MSNEPYEEWDLDDTEPNEGYPYEIADDSLGDTDYPESNSDDEEEEMDVERVQEYREKYRGHWYYQRNPHRRYEKFTEDEENYSDCSDEDEYSEEEGRRDDDEEDEDESDGSEDVIDEQPDQKGNVADEKALGVVSDVGKDDESLTQTEI